MAMAAHTQAMLESTAKLKRGVEESTRLLRQILDLLPPLPNQNQSTAISCVLAKPAVRFPNQNQAIEISRALEEHERLVDSNEISRNGTIAAAEVFAAMPALEITTADGTVEAEHVISSSVKTELVTDTNDLIIDLGLVLDDAIDFWCGKTNVWGSFNVYESVKVSIESVVQPTKSYVEDETVGSPEPLPTELRSGYSFIDCTYPALTFSFDTSRVPCPAMNCYCIVYLLPYNVFEYGSISLVDDPYGFQLLLMGGVAHDDYMVRSNLGQKLDVYEDLVESTSIWQVFDKNSKRKTSESILFSNVSSYECWQTSDFFQSQLFDPSISKLIINANRLIEHRFLVGFVPNDASIFMKHGVEFILNEAEQKSTLLLGTCIVDFTEKCNGVRSPNNQLMNVYYGDSVGEYVARVTPIYFDPGGYVSHVFLLGFEFDIGLSDIDMWLFKLPFGRSSIVVFKIAWNQNNIADVLQKPEQLERLYSEVLAFKDTMVSFVCEEKKLPKLNNPLNDHSHNCVVLSNYSCLELDRPLKSLIFIVSSFNEQAPGVGKTSMLILAVSIGILYLFLLTIEEDVDTTSFVGNGPSSTRDTESVIPLNMNCVKLVCWNENGWGYSSCVLASTVHTRDYATNFFMDDHHCAISTVMSSVNGAPKILIYCLLLTTEDINLDMFNSECCIYADEEKLNILFRPTPNMPDSNDVMMWDFVNQVHTIGNLVIPVALCVAFYRH